MSSRGAASKSGRKPKFYGVARGFKPGVYETWEEANTHVKNYSGHRVKKFRPRKEAEEYVADAQANPERIWYVLKGSRRDGAYESKTMSSFWRGFGSTMVERNSLTAVKRFLRKSRIRIYRNEWGAGDETGGADDERTAADSAAAVPNTQEAVASADAQHQRKFFSCKGGSEDGVYDSYRSLKEV